MDVQRKVSILFIRPSRDGAVLCDWVWRACVHTGFRTITLVLSVYRIFTKLGRMIPLWKGKNPIYFGVIRSKVKVTVRCKYNFWQQGRFRTITSSVYWIFNKLGHMIPLWKGKNPIYFRVIRSKVKVIVTINIILTTGSFPHDNFSSVYLIFTKLDHMFPLWKAKNPIYFGVKGQGHCYYE